MRFIKKLKPVNFRLSTNLLKNDFIPVNRLTAKFECMLGT